MTYRTRNIAIAVGLALVAMLLTLVYVTSYRRSVQHAQATVNVYVAAHDIPAGTAGSGPRTAPTRFGRSPCPATRSFPAPSRTPRRSRTSWSPKRSTPATR